MTRLARLLDKFAQPLEADLAHIPQDLRDFYLPAGGPSKLTPRRLLVLIDGLGPESRLWAAVHHHEKRSAERAMVTRLRRGKKRFESRKKRGAGNG